MELTMTKDEMRALLADLVPSAIAEGRAYVVRRPAGKSARELPSDKCQVQTKPVRPMRMFPRQGVMGAGFKVPTFKPLQGVNPNHNAYPVPLSNDATRLTPTFTCPVCEQHGANCTC